MTDIQTNIVKKTVYDGNLYILDKTPYVIEDDLSEINKVYVPQDSYDGYLLLNPSREISSKMKPYNYSAISTGNVPFYDNIAVIMTSETNAPMMAAMYSKGLAANEDYMTLSEAKAVTKDTLGNFRYNEDITSFREFKYFTNVTELPTNFMFDVPNLEYIDIPESVTKLNHTTFGISSSKHNLGWESKLKYVTGLKNVEYVGRNSFQFCYDLISLDFSQKLTSIDVPFNCLRSLETLGDVSNVDTYIPSTAKMRLLYDAETIQTLYMPKFNIIGDYSFYQAYNLTNLTLDWGNVTSIADFAFANTDQNPPYQTSNKIEFIPDLPNLETIGTGAFQQCKYLKYVGDMPKITDIPKYCFNMNINLRKIGDISNVESIGNYGFSCCFLLEKLDLPKCSVVGKEAFSLENPETFQINPDKYSVHRTINFGLPYESITWGNDVLSEYDGVAMTKVFCNGEELTEEQYEALGGHKPTW